jgi:ribosomal-protein-alanine N-acetyltransferase
VSAGWPAHLEDGTVVVRPLGRGDRAQWLEVRLANEDWLRPWEATPPGGDTVTWRERNTRATYAELLRRQRVQGRRGTHYPFGVFVEGRFAGQVSLGEVVRGAFYSAYVGYWVDERVAGRGVTPTAVALVIDHAFRSLGLHRVEANVRPENVASLAVVRKLGFTEEGRHRDYLAIDGDWRDHLTFALLKGDHPGGVLAGLRDRRT